MDDLALFRQFASRKRFAFKRDGEPWDCGLLCCEWLRRRSGHDLARAWLRYSTPLGLERLLRREGGMVALFDHALLPLGYGRTETIQRGDIAIVKTLEGPTAGVITGPGVVLPAAEGIIIRALDFAPVMAAWRI